MAARVWVGSTGNWSDTAHWSLTSGGAGGQTVPGTSDTATIDNHASGLNGGTLTIDQDVSVQSIVWTNAVGTIDNSANHNVTCSAAAGFSGSGSTARTWIGGSGTYTLSGANCIWNMSVSTNMTNPTTAFASCTITLTGVSTTNATFNGGTLTYGTVNFNANKGVNLAGTSGTFAALGATGPNALRFGQGVTLTITAAFSWNGTPTAPILIDSSNPANGAATITTGSATANTATWCAFSHIVFTPVGGSTLSATKSLDFGVNSGTGFAITPPAFVFGG